MSLIIFTSLDKILSPLEEHEYELVMAVAQELQSRSIPLILVTNSTRAEVEEWSQKTGLNSPFIVEQGSGIFIPQANCQFIVTNIISVENYHLYQLGCTYTEARAALKAIQEEINKILRGFGDLDEENIQSLLGLSLAAARRAKAREFSEYFITPNRIAVEKLQEIATEYGFKIIAGDDLSLVMGGKANPGKAIEWLKHNYQAASDAEIVTAGLGSTKQDLAMLEAVDVPVIIPNSGGLVDLSFADKDWQISSRTGFLGWVESIKQICRNYLD
ncbi:MAG: haloacid dehalogenase [Pleurocapsa sp. MO_192.B19]|nr:haloacid dehalogenase [Pleurocapsa sp. MO_192.B19]